MRENFVWYSSRLGPLLFDIFISDLILFTNDIDIASYSDDSTPYATSFKTTVGTEKLEQCSDSLHMVSK